MESDSANAVMWVLHKEPRPWKYQFHFMETRELCSHLDVAKQGVDKTPLGLLLLCSCLGGV